MDAYDEFRYARSGDISIGYATYGEGPPDVVFAHGNAGNIEIERETAFQREFHDRVASFSRFILFDRRGTGLSDRPREPATLEARMDDVRAVLDAAESDSAVLFGTVEAAAMCTLFAATYPERTLGLILYNGYAKGTWAPDYPWARRWRNGGGSSRKSSALGNERTRRADGSCCSRLRGRQSGVHRSVGAPRPALGQPERGCDDPADGGRRRRP